MLRSINRQFQQSVKRVISRDGCPKCDSKQFKKNGHLPSGKQSQQCNDCGRQFVLDFEQRLVSEEHRAMIQRLLAERLSLRGICRAVGVGMKWLMGFIVECYEAVPEHLNVHMPACPDSVLVYGLKAEADELQSFVGKKQNKQWLWLAIDSQTRRALAFHVGDRSQKSAHKLWDRLPAEYRQNATFWTDGYSSYQGVIPASQHRVVTKASRQTNHIERLNCTLRQRVSRLVRATLCFSKKLDNHIGAIKYFLSHYNLELARA
jgi:IS1 family transposase/transposase-like protein